MLGFKLFRFSKKGPGIITFIVFIHHAETNCIYLVKKSDNLGVILDVGCDVVEDGRWKGVRYFQI